MSVVTEEERRRQSGGPHVAKGVLYEHGNQRVLQPHEVGAAEKYANDYWSQGHVPPPRTPTSGPGGQTPSRVIPGAPVSNIQASIYTGFTPKHAMRGFDFGREQNTGKSAKDAYAFLANQAPPPPVGNKDAIAVWFRTYIQPGMQQLGHNVTDVTGDKFRFNNWQGDFWVDHVENAGLETGNLAWQADYAQGGPSNQAYNQTQTAIMGVPRPQTGGTPSVSSAVLAPLAPPQPPAAGPDMQQYYSYLQSLLQEQV